MALRLAVLAGVVALVAVAWLSGLFDLLSDADRARALLSESGPLGPVVFVLAFGLLEPFGLPGILFVVPATAVWPLWLAFLLSWLGSVLAGVVGFSFARWIGRDWVEDHLPGRMRAYDRRLAEHGLRTVIVVRLMFFLAPPAHWALGLSQVRFAPFVLGTAIGFAPGIALLALFGKGLLEYLGEQPSSFWILGIAAIAIAVLLRQLRAVATSSAEDVSPPGKQRKS